MTTFPDRMGSDGISGGMGDAYGPGSCADASSPSVSPLRAAIPIAGPLAEPQRENARQAGRHAYHTDCGDEPPDEWCTEARGEFQWAWWEEFAREWNAP